MCFAHTNPANVVACEDANDGAEIITFFVVPKTARTGFFSSLVKNEKIFFGKKS
jgi:hypothetical protein